jgi:hypothetical protein
MTGLFEVLISLLSGDQGILVLNLSIQLYNSLVEDNKNNLIHKYLSFNFNNYSHS